MHKKPFVIIGILILVISLYWITNSGYHLIYYDETLGYNQPTFGHGIPYYQIVLKFFFWLIMIFSGIGLIKSNKIGLIIGQIGISISGTICFIYVFLLTFRHINYSTNMVVNSMKHEMTFLEKWELIYSQPVKYWTLLGLIISILIMIRFRKFSNKTQAHNRVDRPVSKN
ncbi:hypothetical protein NH26_24935 [Flammeovirga pacifica]|uniref:Uncharacterized protein n=1 Tax=Flammeovirga pacifica TaxID=915059 RepID=A0A1S1YRJ1_FLAPC|nr:hypothetical protein NH26_24935 [Flammeovirga pacifica]